ncbi:hypothetical protein T484DRAFT_1756397 [Baffinella frigidus]|nr:hypothetical protein T484DRAFT_1756397 [Cryptophyta sp. CCMP2293]
MGNSFGSSAGGGLGPLGRVLVFEVDKNLNLTSWNAECEAVFGRRAEEVVGGPLHIAVPLKSRNNDEVPSVPTRLPDGFHSHPRAWGDEQPRGLVDGTPRGVQPPCNGGYRWVSGLWGNLCVYPGPPQPLFPPYTNRTRALHPRANLRSGATSPPHPQPLSSTRTCNPRPRRQLTRLPRARAQLRSAVEAALAGAATTLELFSTRVDGAPAVTLTPHPPTLSTRHG